MKAITLRFNPNIPSDKEIVQILEKKIPIEVEGGVYLVGSDLIKNWIYKGMTLNKGKFPDSFCDSSVSGERDAVVAVENKQETKKEQKKKFDPKKFSSLELGGTEPHISD
jgi:hypothetical protein